MQATAIQYTKWQQCEQCCCHGMQLAVHGHSALLSTCMPDTETRSSTLAPLSSGTFGVDNSRLHHLLCRQQQSREAAQVI